MGTSNGQKHPPPQRVRFDAPAHDRGVVLLRGARARASRYRVRRVLLLATTTGYQIRSFGEAAEKLGVRLVFASDRCDQLDDTWSDHAIPVRFWDETHSLEATLAACRADPIHGIIAVGDH